MSKLDDVKASLQEVLEKIRESEAYAQLRAKYDELDSRAKLYLHIGAAAALVLLLLGSVFAGMLRVASLKSAIDANEALIGYLNQSADALKQLKEKQASAQGGVNLNAPLDAFVSDAIENSGIDKAKVNITPEAVGEEDKTSREARVEVRLSEVNLRQITKILFALVDQGGAKGLNIVNLSVRAKEDFSGWLDAAFTVSIYKAK